MHSLVWNGTFTSTGGIPWKCMSEVLKGGSICVTSVLDLLLPGTSHFVHPVVSQFKKQITVPRPRYAATISYFEKRFFKSACVLYVMVDLGSNLLI